MAISNPYQQYQQNSIMSANPGQLTLMLYNGAIRFIKTAINSMGKKDISATNNALIRAQDIVRYLDETLNHDYEIAEQFSLLYDYIYRRLIEANLKKDVSILNELEKMVEELRDTWTTVIKENIK